LQGHSDICGYSGAGLWHDRSHDIFVYYGVSVLGEKKKSRVSFRAFCYGRGIVKSNTIMFLIH